MLAHVPQKTGTRPIAPLGYLILFLVIGLPMAWLAFEFSTRRGLRIAVGLAAVASAMGVAYIVDHLSQFNYNAWYGGASKDLVDTVISEVEDGNLDRVMSVLRRLNLDYQPTYQNRARYDELVNEAVTQMKGDHDLVNTKWDTSPFTRDTWVGHWEDDTGYWIVINWLGKFDIARSGDNMTAISDVSISDDRRNLAFAEGDRWRHELTLTDKCTATHVWLDLTDNSVWQINTIHKLRRATPAERAFTKQKE
jgi:hypothetical protein